MYTIVKPIPPRGQRVKIFVRSEGDGLHVFASFSMKEAIAFIEGKKEKRAANLKQAA